MRSESIGGKSALGHGLSGAVSERDCTRWVHRPGDPIDVLPITNFLAGVSQRRVGSDHTVGTRPVTSPFPTKDRGCDSVVFLTVPLERTNDMNMTNTWILTAACLASVGLAQQTTRTKANPQEPAAGPATGPATGPAADSAAGPNTEPATDSPKPAPTGLHAFAVQPAPLGDAAKKGVRWLLKHQQKGGGWGQGEESQQMGQGMAGLAAKANVGDTCVAAMVLLRTEEAVPGSHLAGPHQEELRQAMRFVLREIEASDEDSMWVTSVRGTRIQSKIGQYIDTSLASILLGEMLGRMGSDNEDARVENALAKVTHKLAKNMKADGSWENQGWAGGIQSAAATKGYFRAMSNASPGSAIASGAVSEAFEANVRNWRTQAGQSLSGLGYADSAGVALYGSANQLSSLDEIVRSQQPQAKVWKLELAGASITPESRKELEKKVKEFEATKSQLARNRELITSKLDDEGFVSGFGSNGGEEFWSYWNLSEALVREGGNEWRKWEAAMKKNLGRIQNTDGSWNGHHCITGRTFCTSAALLVLLADRTPASPTAVNAPAEPSPAGETAPAGEPDATKPGTPGVIPPVEPAPVIREAERVGPIKDGKRHNW